MAPMNRALRARSDARRPARHAAVLAVGPWPSLAAAAVGRVRRRKFLR